MTAGADIGLLRFFRARVDETTVLNAAARAPVPLRQDAALCGRLLDAAARLRAAAACEDGRAVAYDRLATLPAFAAYRAVAGELAGFDPGSLATRGERLAFWINVYNALTIDAVAAFGVHGSIRDVPGFFRRAAYRIGGERFSLEEIEHGILRGNRPPLPRLAPPFAVDDPRRALCILPPDPRVHFALHCATRSCPPLRAYTPAQIAAELEAAAAAFVQGDIAVEGERVAVSSIFSTYAEDFGGPEGVADWICRCLDDPAGAERVRQAFARGTVVYEAYDWALNAR